MSGFSSLASQLAEELGIARAAEVLLERIKRVHSELVAPVHAYGGAVIGFAGDSISCWFDDEPMLEGPVDAAAQRAVACALEMQSRPLSGFGLKVGVACGAARRFMVGDPDILRIDTLAGETLERMAAAERSAQRGEVVVSEETLALAEVEVGDTRAYGSRRYAVVTGQRRAARKVAWPAHVPDAKSDGAPISFAQWVPRAIQARLEREPSFAELRAVAPMFASFEGIDFDADDDAQARLDALTRHVQKVFERAGGLLLELTIGDKGCFLYGVVGAPIAQSDTPQRALTAAAELSSSSQRLLPRPLAIGVSFGRVWAGVAGAPERACYAVMGDEVNLAARLMQRAAPGQVLVSASLAASGGTHAFDPLGEVGIKGRAAPVPVFALQRREPSRGLTQSRGGLFGRKRELSLVDEILERAAGGNTRVLFVEGRPGMGKTRLATAIAEHTKAKGAAFFACAGDSIERDSPLFAFRALFRQLLSLSDAEVVPTDRVRERVEALDPKLVERLPLMGPLLGVEIPDNDLTRWMSDELRADNTRELAVSLIARARRSVAAPFLILLDDAHWIDSASWSLVRRLSQSVEGLALVALGRPTSPDEQPEDLAKLLALPETLRSELSNLDEADTLALLCERVGVSRLPARLATFVVSRAAGHPLLADLLAARLRDLPGVSIEDGQCRLADSFDEARIELPDTVEGVIAEGLDRLAAEEAAVLGRASVLGVAFEAADIDAISEGEPTEPRLAALVDRELLERRGQAFAFRHALVRDVAYGRLLFATRRKLHAAAAARISGLHAADLTPFHVVLAHHYLGAEARTDASHHFGRAGEVAIRSGAFRETTLLLARALELAPPELGDEQRAHYSRRLANAWYRLGNLPESTRRAEEAVSVYDRVVPKEGAGLGLLVLRELGQQVGKQLLTSVSGGRYSAMTRAPAPDSEGRRAAVSLYQNLSEVYYLGGLQGPSIYAALRQVNVAEQTGPCSELAEAYGVLAIIAGVIGSRSISRRYERMAEQVVGQLANPRVRAMMLHQRSLSRAAFGEYAAVTADESEAVQVFQRLGDLGRMRDALGLWGTTQYLASDFDGAQRTLETLLSTRTGDDRFVQEIWGSAWLGAIALTRGRTETALPWLLRSVELLDKNTVGLMEVSSVGMLGLAQYRLGARADALRSIARASDLIEKAKGRPAGHISLDGFTAVAEVYRAESASPSATKAEQAFASERFRKACAWLKTFAGVFPIGEPAANRMAAELDLPVRPTRARKAIQAGIASARALGMRQEELRLLELEARISEGAARALALDRAAQLRAALGVREDPSPTIY